MEFLEQFIQKCHELYENEWEEITLNELQSNDGRSKPPGSGCTTGSYLYVAYENDTVLYVGETSKSIKRRFITDGSGSHKQKSAWYSRITLIKYIKKTDQELPTMRRKLFEQAFSIFFTPEFYGRSNI